MAVLRRGTAVQRHTKARGKSAKAQRHQTLAPPKAVRPDPALAATPDGLHLLLETALDAVIVMQSDGAVADWNDRAASVFVSRIFTASHVGSCHRRPICMCVRM